MSAAECFRSRELASEVGVIEHPRGEKTLDRGVDVIGWLTLFDQKAAQLRDAACARREHVEGSLVRGSPWLVGFSHARKEEPGSRSLFRREFPGPIVARLLLPGPVLSAGMSPTLLFRHLDVADDLTRSDTEQRLHLLFDFGHQRGAVLEI